MSGRSNPRLLRPFLGATPALAPETLRTLLLVSLGLFFENYDLGLVNAALPQIAEGLGMAAEETGYYLSLIRLGGIGHPLRQIAIRNIGHDQPTLLITNDLTTPAKDLFTRYAERMIIENELDADISGFHLNA